MAENIHQAINAVMREVGYVQKQKAAALNYTYAGESALIAALRPSMVEHGVYCAVVAITDVVRGDYTTSRGNAMQSVDLTATIRFTHAPSETHIDVVALGSGADSGDKASNKALTGAYKYALRQTFSIETGDDPDAAHEERASRQAAKTAAKTTSKVADKPAAARNGNGEEKFEPARIKGALGDGWPTACAELAEKFPAYQTVLKGGELSGRPNFNHILAAAAICGFAEVTKANYEAVIEAVAKRAAEKAAVPA